jgi:hypothetical protein
MGFPASASPVVPLGLDEEVQPVEIGHIYPSRRVRTPLTSVRVNVGGYRRA